jgi:hypothetical protein
MVPRVARLPTAVQPGSEGIGQVSLSRPRYRRVAEPIGAGRGVS